MRLARTIREGIVHMFYGWIFARAQPKQAEAKPLRQSDGCVVLNADSGPQRSVRICGYFSSEDLREDV